jgi:hypothetical protein
LELICLRRWAAWRLLFDSVDTLDSMAISNVPDKGDEVDRMNRVPRNFVNFPVGRRFPESPVLGAGA